MRFVSEEKKEYNTMEEGNISSKEAGEILEEDDVNLAEEAVSKEESSETEDSAAEQEEKTSEKKGLFGKKKKDKKDEKIEELTDMVKRQMAEFDNFRKRTEKEKASMYQVGAKEIVEKILPVVDNFERGLAMIPENEKENPVATGMTQIYKQLMTAFDEMGVKTIEAVGQEFNPDFHNAVMHIEDEEAGENVIVEEFQKGYMYKDSVIRHSMVKVAN
ncbi:MAG: nucleotide exchange factor GrpE [Lachnospiraceae bacterium]|nr:nucleotide exchange factor GrpE [Lachnospiraceae bacterium]